MQSTNQAPPVSKAALWTGWVLTIIPVLMILMGSSMKLMKTTAVIEGFAKEGLPAGLILPVGLIELICVVVYLIPATSVLGAILMTGLLGGAILTCVRVADRTFAFPLILGMMAWGGLFLRDRRLRELIPLRRKLDSF